MDAVIGLIILSVIIILGVFGELFFKKTNIPDVLWLILFGFLITRVFNLVNPTYFDSIIPVFVAVTLIIILFEGGLHLKLGGVIKYSLTGSVLAILYFILVTGLITGATYLLSLTGLLPDWTIWWGIILGAILGGTSSIVVMPLLKNAGFSEDKTNILSIESALTDALCVVVVLTLLTYLSTEGQSLKLILQNVTASFAIGIVSGVIIGFLWLVILSRLKNTETLRQYFYFLTIALLIIVYIFVEYIGGSAVVAIFVFGLITGSSGIFNRIFKMQLYELDNDILLMNSQLAFLIKSFFFVLMGILLVVSFDATIIAVILSVILLFGRYLTILIIPTTHKMVTSERRLLYFFAPKGLAAGILGIEVAKYTGLIKNTDLFVNIVFAIIIISILLSTFGMFTYKYFWKKSEIAETSINNENPDQIN